MKRSLYSSLLFLVLIFLQSPAYSQTQFKLKSFTPETFPTTSTSVTTVKHALASSELGVIVNTQDPQSVQVANYYQNVRNIPAANIIQVSFPPGNQNMGRNDFNILRADVLSRTPANVQAFALTWTTPWKVDCMSITSAFAFGFDASYCQPANAQTCYTTLLSDYYASDSRHPRTDLSIIPTMMIAGLDFNKVKSVIDRGKISDLSFPRGDGYFITTTDTVRSARTSMFGYAATIWSDSVNSLKITHIDNSGGFAVDNYLQNVQNILFYLTGTYIVQGLNTLQFVPGSVADHLTSYGGALTAGYDDSQMPILRWLEAGVTGSYGTVVEPCAYAAKFPDPQYLLPYYFSGESLIESYWKSVAMPIEGLFVGEPLAKPWGTKVNTLATGEVEIFTTSLRAGKSYHLLTQSQADTSLYDVVQSFTPQSAQFRTIKFTPSATQYYLLSEDELSSLNQAPVLAAIGNKVADENKTLTFQISATDADGDPITYSASNLPLGATFNQSTRTFNWKPSYTQAGTYNNIIFQASDAQSSDTESISIQVRNVNRAPVFNAIGNKTIAEDSTLTFTVSATDADGEALVYSASNLPSGATFNASTRTFTWRPSFSQAGVYSNVTFTVTDGITPVNSTISITVSNTNRAPTLSAIGNKVVAENSLLEFVVSATDLDSDVLTYSAVNLPAGASFNAVTHVFSWTPNFNQAGVFSNIQFSVTDNIASVSETISITVNNTNRPPIITAIGNKSVLAGTLLEFQVAATDPDGDAVTLSSSALPGTSTFNTLTGVFSWATLASQIGNYQVQFTATDTKNSATEIITISVTGSNNPPVLTAIGNKNVAEASLLTFIVSATDVDGDSLIYSVSNLPSGAIFNPSTRVFTWTPNYSQAGIYPNVIFSVTDGKVTTTESISITVANTNRSPVLNAIGGKSVTEGQLLQFTVSATDADGDVLVYSASNLPNGASFNASTKTFSWTPQLGQFGNYTVPISVTDGALSVKEDVLIVVNKAATNSAPVMAAIGNKTVVYGQNLSFVVSATDANGDVLTYRAQNLPAGASFNSATRQFSFTPAFSQIGTFSPVRFIVSDGKAEDFKDISIRVVGKKAALLDYTGDRRSENAYYRPSGLLFATYNQASNSVQNLNPFGTTSSKPIQGDFDGDGILDRAVTFDTGVNTNIKWQIKLSSSSAVVEKTLGLAGDVTLAGDLNGDNRDEIVVFRTGTWYYLNEAGVSTIYYNFGQAGDIPNLVDFDGDGYEDLALFRPSTGEWFILYYKLDQYGNRTFKTKQWGANGDVPVPADFDGNGVAEIAVYRPANSTWYSYNLQTGSSQSVTWGTSGAVPVVGDFNGDGKIDYSVFRSSDGRWYHNFRNSTGITVVFGKSGDLVPKL